MLLQALFNRFITATTATISFDQRRCLRARLNTNECRVCLDVCPSRALSLSNQTVQFDNSRCTSCLRCLSVCPNDALTDSIDLGHLLHQLAHKSGIIISCDQSKTHDNQLTIPCIGLLSEPLLAAMNAVSQGTFHLDVEHCPRCRNQHTLCNLHQINQKLQKQSKDRGGEFRLLYWTEQDRKKKDHSLNERRVFLSFTGKSIARNSKKAVRQATNNPEATPPDQKSTLKQPTKIQKVLRTAMDLLPPDRTGERDILRSYFFTLQAAPHCDCCPRCSGMCPTGALKRTTENGSRQLNFTSSSCSGCGLCIAFCKKKALQIHQGYANDPRLTVQLIQQTAPPTA